VSVSAAFKRMVPVVFEKDDDDNGHIDFITAASVCRSHSCYVPAALLIILHELLVSTNLDGYTGWP